jgi:hypothetical protein
MQPPFQRVLTDPGGFRGECGVTVNWNEQLSSILWRLGVHVVGRKMVLSVQR